MLTGALPFTASDPMEWIHCHIARHPVPVSERVDGIPAVLSAIVSKLMSKNAEDRYQTALDWKQDLRKCLAEWESRGRIDLFRLAHTTLRPVCLFRRSSTDASLRSATNAAFDRVVTSGRPETRTRLRIFRHRQILGGQRTAESACSSARSVCIRKIRPIQEGHPYATLCQALRGLVLRFLGKSDTELANWRTCFR